LVGTVAKVCELADWQFLLRGDDILRTGREDVEVGRKWWMDVLAADYFVLLFFLAGIVCLVVLASDEE
jgi:hypothetical protein